MRALDLAVDALAVFRLTKLVVDDEIFADAREKLLDRFHPDETKIGYLITCPWCVSIWAGGAVVVARAVAPRAWDLAAQALAFSAVTGLAAERT